MNYITKNYRKEFNGKFKSKRKKDTMYWRQKAECRLWYGTSNSQWYDPNHTAATNGSFCTQCQSELPLAIIQHIEKTEE